MTTARFTTRSSRWTRSGCSDRDDMQKMRAFFERGNRITLDSLVKRFGGA